MFFLKNHLQSLHPMPPFKDNWFDVMNFNLDSAKVK